MDGADGATGPAGPPGADGSAGAGNATGVLTTGCLGPCHGFTGIVEQWKTSTHYATFIANLGGDEVPTWTGATGCGNCHAIDAIEQRVAGNVLFATGSAAPTNLASGETNYFNLTTSKVTEATYAGQAEVAVVTCSTCHDTSAQNDPHVTGLEYVPGSFPLRVPTGPADQARIEKSAAAGVPTGTQAGLYGAGNACVWCHKSRQDVTSYIVASNNLTSTHWGPHEGPQADIYSGKGGYQYPATTVGSTTYGGTYSSSTHSGFANGCVTCHMPAVASNQGIGDHSFYAQLSACQGCHTDATSFNYRNVGSIVKGGLQELRVAMNNLGWLTRSEATPYVALTTAELADTNYQLDLTRPGVTGLTGAQAGAIYNYLLLARGSGGGVHNPNYAKQLIFDSLFALNGAAGTSVPFRP